MPGLIAPPLPAGVELLWQAFAELHGTRRGSGFGLDPIACADVLAWQRMSRTRLTPWEVETLLLMDRAALVALQSETEPQDLEGGEQDEH